MDFECSECGYESAKWMGRCPRCGEWDTLVETAKYETAETVSATADIVRSGTAKLTDIDRNAVERFTSGMKGFDDMMGGGFVEGETVLVGGPPGVGKSTLFLQLAEGMSRMGKKILFVSGEESPSQVKLRSERLELSGKNITVAGSGDLGELLNTVKELGPDVIFVDSVQAVMVPGAGGSPGSLNQIKLSGQRLTGIAKNTPATVFISGQVTKQGDIAGPKVLEHMVDAVVYMDYMEGSSRIVRAKKNRFGSCGDFMVYRLSGKGLVPAQEFVKPLSKEMESIVGQAAACIRGGMRLLTVEFQTLISPSHFEYPLRRTSGFPRERLLMLSAIAEKHIGIKTGANDIYLNVSGETRISERSADLAVIASLYSAAAGIPVSTRDIYMGEVGLSGEVRPVGDIEERIGFAVKNGFKKAVISGFGRHAQIKGIELMRIRHVRELEKALPVL